MRLHAQGNEEVSGRLDNVSPAIHWRGHSLVPASVLGLYLKKAVIVAKYYGMSTVLVTNKDVSIAKLLA